MCLGVHCTPNQSYSEACSQDRSLRDEMISADTADFPKWKQQVAAWQDKLKLHAKSALWPKLGCNIRGYHVGERVSAILNMLVAEKLTGIMDRSLWNKQNALQAIQPVILDVSQNPGRKAFTGNNGIAHTLCTSSHLLHLGLGRVLLPVERLLLQGHNAHQLRFPRDTSGRCSMSPRKIRCLAGEGMFLPSLGLLMWCLLLTGSLDQEIGQATHFARAV